MTKKDIGTLALFMVFLISAAVAGVTMILQGLQPLGLAVYGAACTLWGHLAFPLLLRYLWLLNLRRKYRKAHKERRKQHARH